MCRVYGMICDKIADKYVQYDQYAQYAQYAKYVKNMQEICISIHKQRAECVKNCR